MLHLVKGDPNGLLALHLVEEAGQLGEVDPQLEIKVQDNHLLHPEDWRYGGQVTKCPRGIFDDEEQSAKCPRGLVEDVGQ